MLSKFDLKRREEIKVQLEAYRNGPKKRISEGLADVSFDDLSDALRGIDLVAVCPKTQSYNLLKLEKKMDRNNLSEETRKSIRSVITMAPVVSDFIRERSMHHDEEFPERLTKCFRLIYEEFSHNGYDDDDLYDTITLDFISRAGIKTPNGRYAIAALQAYLFERCEIFKTLEDEKQMREKWGEW